jgi:hypothetical protein
MFVSFIRGKGKTIYSLMIHSMYWKTSCLLGLFYISIKPPWELRGSCCLQKLFKNILPYGYYVKPVAVSGCTF